MTFLSPAILWALPLGLLPIIIYLLMRFRTLRVAWGADYVLQRAIERMRKKLFLEQLLLIALRILALIALVLAFARPVSQDEGTLASGTGVHRILIVDCSYSMAANAGERTRWSAVTDVLAELARTWGRNERWSLYVIDDQPGWRVRDQAIASSEEVLAELAALEPVEASAALGRALDEVLAEVAGGETEIYIASDDQAITWDDTGAIQVTESEDLRLFWVAPDAADDANRAVTAVTPGSDRVLRGHPLRVFVTVRNYGRDPVVELPIEVLIDGRVAGRETISLQSGQELDAELDVAFDEAGSHVVTARIDGDTLGFDDAASAGVQVIDRITVGVLRDPDRDDLFESSYPILELAGRVFDQLDKDVRANLEVALVDGAVDAATLAAYDALVLDGGRSLDAGLATALRSYVDAGGALVLAASESVDAVTWNRELAAVRLLPAEIGALNVVELDEEGAASPRRDLERPAFRNFATVEDGDISSLRFHSWFDLVEPSPEAEVLVDLGTGEPLVVQRDHGLGSVTLMAAGLDGNNNNLIAREVFVPFLTRLFSAAVSRAGYPRTVGTDESVRAILATDRAVRGATFEQDRLASKPVTVTVTADGARPVLELPGGSSRSGAGSFLAVTEGGTERIHVGIQGPRVDSDLRGLDDFERERLLDRLSLQQVTGWDELAKILAASDRGAERYAWVLIAMLLFLTAELFVARRFVA